MTTGLTISIGARDGKSLWDRFKKAAKWKPIDDEDMPDQAAAAGDEDEEDQADAGADEEDEADKGEDNKAEGGAGLPDEASNMLGQVSEAADEDDALAGALHEFMAEAISIDSTECTGHRAY